MKHSRRGGAKNRNKKSSKTTADLLRLICGHLMSPNAFSRVNLEGSNVGSVLTVRRSGDSEESVDGYNINVFVSNNIQGVNNSILVGSSVQMGDPGVGFYLDHGDLDGRKTRGEDSVSVGWSGFLVCFAIAILLLLFVLFA